MIDTHAHLDHPRFDEDRAEVIRRAGAAGVFRIVTVGCDLKSSREAVGLAAANEAVFATVGIHPHEAEAAAADDPEMIAELAGNPKVVAVGETGLDYHYNFSPPAVQMDMFRRHVRMARTRGLPLIVHEREAGEDLLRVLREESAGEAGGVVHCFTGSRDVAAGILELGFHISVGGVVTFPNAAQVREVVAWLPLDRLLLETDSPYLAPQVQRGKRNEPANLPHIAEAVAALRQVEPERLAEVTDANAAALFRW